jgi:myosin heavy subunit
LDKPTRAELGLNVDNPAAYRFLMNSEPPPKGECCAAFNEVMSAFTEIGFTADRQKNILQVLVSVLLLGQMRYENDGTAADGSIERDGSGTSNLAAKVRVYILYMMHDHTYMDLVYGCT